MSTGLHLYVDADACPVKAETVKVAERHGLPVVFVANTHLAVPRGPRVRVQVVPGSFDAADDWIVERAGPGDIVVTADIPLASLVIERGAHALNPHGELYTPGTIRERLSMRNFMESLRSAGVDTGGPAAFSQADRQAFANQLDRFLARIPD